MSREECEQNIREFGHYNFEGWVECQDNYPELDDIALDATGGELPDTLIISEVDEETPDDQIRRDTPDERKLNDLFYIMIGSIALLLLFIILVLTRKK